MTEEQKKQATVAKTQATKEAKKKLRKIKSKVVVNGKKHIGIATYHGGSKEPAVKVCYEDGKTKYWVFVKKIEEGVYYAE